MRERERAREGERDLYDGVDDYDRHEGDDGLEGEEVEGERLPQSGTNIYSSHKFISIYFNSSADDGLEGEVQGERPPAPRRAVSLSGCLVSCIGVIITDTYRHTDTWIYP